MCEVLENSLRHKMMITLMMIIIIPEINLPQWHIVPVDMTEQMHDIVLVEQHKLSENRILKSENSK